MAAKNEVYRSLEAPGDTVANYIASVIGGEVTAKRVRTLIDRSNEDKIIFHGVKDSRSVRYILEEGIRPLTPEGGNVSFWTSGERIFISDRDPPSPYDTPLFQYGHSRSGSSDLKAMTIVATTKDALWKIDPSIRIPNNACLIVGFIVPRSDISVLRVNLRVSGLRNFTPREISQRAEQQMFGLIERFVNGEFSLGNMEIVDKTI